MLNDTGALGVALIARGYAPETPQTVLARALIAPSIDRRWFDEVLPLVERALNRLALEFLNEPYRHRCEHSLHCELYRLLTDTPPLAGTIQLGATTVRPVQKEWPETGPTMDRERRGLYDLAVLAPSADAAIDRAAFIDGYVKPGIVIEVGLNDDLAHLQQDRRKLEESGVRDTYLVHFARSEGDRQEGVEREVGSMIAKEAEGGPKVLYASTSTRRWRQLATPWVVAAP